jgi:hypothetical protein
MQALSQSSQTPSPNNNFPPNHSQRKELEISAVGTVRVKPQLFANSNEGSVKVYSATMCMSEKEPFRIAAEKIAEWKRTVSQLRGSQN